MSEKESQRSAFVRALYANDDDHVTRLIFADWLDDHDEPEEADRMRAYKGAKEWLKDFAAKVDISFEEAVKGGYESLDVGINFEPDNFLCDPDNLKEYWAAWSIVTGEKSKQDAAYSPFYCNC